MHEKKAIPLAAVAVIALLLGTVIHQSAVYGAPSSRPPSPRPILTVKVSSHVCEAYERVVVWFYITNPTVDMEVDYTEWVCGKPIHIVEVNSIILHCVTPSGGTWDAVFVAPEGSESLEARWVDPIVYPMEKSMVFCMTLAHVEGGTYEYTCTAEVTYERRNPLHPAYFQS